VPRGRDDEERLMADIVALAREYGRYGYRKITALLRAAGWLVNAKRVERIWRREGLKVPAKQPKKGRLWLSDGSCVRLRPEHPNHVWAYDFVEDRTHDGRKFRMLNVVDEFTHECLAIRVARKLKATDVIDVLSDLFMPRAACRAISAQIMARSSWLRPFRTGSKLWAPRPPTSPRAHPGRTATHESFNARLRDELLHGEIFYSLREAEIILESWRRHYNTVRPHASLGYRPPAPEVFIPAFTAGPAAPPRLAPPAKLPVAPRPVLH
jgi:transposase InsO family protein